MAEIIHLQGINHTSTNFNWGNFPMFFGMACFSLEGIGLIFPIRGSLKQPDQFTRLFVIVASSAVLLYMIFGTVCNLALGNSVMSIVFHNFPKNYTVIFILQFAYALGIFTTFPLYIQACINTIKKISLFKCLYQGKKENIMTTLSRAVLIMMIFMICMTGINLLDFMDIAGSVCNSYLAFVLPAMVYITHMEKKKQMSKCSKWVHIILASLGFIMSGITLGFSLYKMFNGHSEKTLHSHNPLQDWN